MRSYGEVEPIVLSGLYRARGWGQYFYHIIIGRASSIMLNDKCAGVEKSNTNLSMNYFATFLNAFVTRTTIQNITSR